MRQECIQAVATALGKTTLNQQEVQDIERNISEAMKNVARRDRQAWRDLSDQERLKAAAEQVAIDLMDKAKRKRDIAFQDVLTQSRNIKALEHPDLPASEVIDRMSAAHGDMSGVQSVDTKAKAIANIYRGELTDLYLNIKGGKGLGIFTDKALVHDIVRERFGTNTDNPLAKQISERMGEVFEKMRDRFNRNGGDIGKLDDWGIPQTHNPAKMAKATKAQWVEDAMGLVNREKYVNDDGSLYSNDQLKELLNYAFDSITMNGANKIEVGKANYQGSAKVTNRHAESRVLHFKDGDAWLEYQGKYGGQTFVDLVESHIATMSRDIAMVETFGSNPVTAFKILQDTARQMDNLRGATDAERQMNGQKSEKTLKRAQVIFDEFRGANTAENEMLANLGLAYRSMNVASMLGGTALSSITDQAMVAKTASVHGLSYRKFFGEFVGQLNPKNKADREFAHSVGLATEEMLGSINRWADDGLTSVHGKSEKLAKISNGVATQVLRASFLNAMTSASKVGFSKLLMSKYGTLSRSKAWGDLDAVDRDMMQGTGLSERVWEVMRLAQPIEDRKGNLLMTARSIYEIPDEKLSAFGDPQKVREEIATQFQAHLLDEQGMAVVEAGVRERTMLQGGGRGTLTGEIWRGFTQFKSFPMALMMRHGSRALSQDTVMGKAKYTLSIVAMTSLLGALVVQLKEIANGNDPQTMWDGDDPQKAIDFFSRSVVQGGGLAFMGDILIGGVDTSGRSTSDYMIGPLGSDIKTALGLTVGNFTQFYNEKDTNAANEAYRALKAKIPAQNLWYTKAVMNRLLFDEFQDSIAPGYREKALRRAEKRYDRTRYWGDDVADVEMPDFDRMVE